RCKILHRDTSTNNILFTGRDSNTEGMLIDYDHAVYKSSKPRNEGKNAIHNFEQTGMLPFMSINNVEGGFDRALAAG
ncbi:hypothetical protein LPJ59_006737, partial [Coemansia sp. RSA 2399]